jgi:hypothetical protein
MDYHLDKTIQTGLRLDDVGPGDEPLLADHVALRRWPPRRAAPREPPLPPWGQSYERTSPTARRADRHRRAYLANHRPLNRPPRPMPWAGVPQPGCRGLSPGNQPAPTVTHHHADRRRACNQELREKGRFTRPARPPTMAEGGSPTLFDPWPSGGGSKAAGEPPSKPAGGLNGSTAPGASGWNQEGRFNRLERIHHEPLRAEAEQWV